MSTLIRIKRLVLRNRIVFTEKADVEMQLDHISEEMVREAIVSAGVIQKTIRSTAPSGGNREYLYSIIGQTWSGVTIYTKGRLEIKNGEERFYVLISSKRNLS